MARKTFEREQVANNVTTYEIFSDSSPAELLNPAVINLAKYIAKLNFFGMSRGRYYKYAILMYNGIWVGLVFFLVI